MGPFYTLVFMLGLSSCTINEVIPPGEQQREQIPALQINRADTHKNSIDAVLEGVGTHCTPNQNKRDCKSGTLCVKSPWDETTGTCLIECGENVDGRLTKLQNKCPSALKCMLYRDQTLTPVGMFCLKPGLHQESECAAPTDEDACADGLSCMPVRSRSDAKGAIVYDTFRCKRECSVEKSCGEQEECLAPIYARAELEEKDGRKINCDVKKCAANDPSCLCDKARNFACAPVMHGLDAGHCKRSLGVCGKPVELASPLDVSDHTYRGATCNERSDNRLCRSHPRSTAATAFPRCEPLHDNSDEGICLARCSRPRIDRNGDGKLGAGENPLSLSCPHGFTCATTMARALGVLSVIMVDGKAKSCDKAACPQSGPCPKQCGPGDGECLRVGRDSNQQHFFCAAPVGLCEKNPS